MGQNARLLFMVIACFLLFSVSGIAQNKKRVNIIRAKYGEYNGIVADAQRLIGDVNIEVDGALIWCDSLYLYTNNNVDAFGNVHVVRGDTLNMYADYVKYNGSTKLAKARRNVRLIDKKVVLTTDSLDYTMKTDVAYYNDYGTIKDSTNVLNSKTGQYFVNEKKAYFKTEVDVVTKDYKIKSDTLIYFTDIKKVFIEGPTRIFSEKDTLYSEYGWYDSMKGFAHLTKKPLIWNDKQKVQADSIFYDKEKGAGLALGHARIQDIENSIIVKGNRVEYNDITKIAMASDSAVLIQYSKTDSLFLHADRLKTMPDTTSKKIQEKKIKTGRPLQPAYTDSIAAKYAPANTKGINPMLTDLTPEEIRLFNSQAALSNEEPKSLPADTLNQEKKKDNRLVLAWHKVRFFRDDFQGKCDSLVYYSKDSTIQLYTDPVLWSERNQITANYIEIINKGKQNGIIQMQENAFIVSMEVDSIRFNQIKGRNMVGHIRNNELIKIDVDGDGQSNYYASDKTGIIGLNRAESSNIIIYMNKGKVKKITFIKSPEGDLKPLGLLEEPDKILPGFKWRSEERPVNQDDIFRNPLTTPPPVIIKKAKEPALKKEPEKTTEPAKVE